VMDLAAGGGHVTAGEPAVLVPLPHRPPQVQGDGVGGGRDIQRQADRGDRDAGDLANAPTDGPPSADTLTVERSVLARFPLERDFPATSDRPEPVSGLEPPAAGGSSRGRPGMSQPGSVIANLPPLSKPTSNRSQVR
jgi:hypothetical protein